MENESKKVGFFSRIKIAVTKLENYSMFLEEKTSICVKYFFLIVLFLVVVMGFSETYSVMQVVSKGYHYIQEELPDFSYEDGKLNFDEKVQAYDEEFDINLIADTSDEIQDEKINEYKDTIKNTGLILLKDKVLYMSEGNVTEYKYLELSESYGLDQFNKQDLIKQVEDIGMVRNWQYFIYCNPNWSIYD